MRKTNGYLPRNEGISDETQPLQQNDDLLRENLSRRLALGSSIILG